MPLFCRKDVQSCCSTKACCSSTQAESFGNYSLVSCKSASVKTSKFSRCCNEMISPLSCRNLINVLKSSTLISTLRNVSQSAELISFAVNHFVHWYFQIIYPTSLDHFNGNILSSSLTAPEVNRNDKPGRKKMPPPPVRSAPAPVPEPNTEEGAVITSTINTNISFM